MREKLSLCSIILNLIILIGCGSLNVNAAEKNELKSRWYEKNEYPIMVGSEEWKNIEYLEKLDILNPPHEVLKEMNTEEIVSLLIDYPYLNDMIGAYDDIYFFFGFLEKHCDFYNEFRDRDDGWKVLLDQYEANKLDYEYLNKHPEAYYLGIPEIKLEFFVCQYMFQFKDEMPNEAYDRFITIMKKNKCNYEQLEKRSLFTELYYWNVDYSSIENNMIQYITAAESFTNSGQSTTKFFNDGTSVATEFWIGSYYKYNTTSYCLKWKQGFMSNTEIAACHTSISSAYPDWPYLYPANNKYNCHSYAWINRSSSNSYWLDSPVNFAASSSFSYIGEFTNISSVTNLQAYDKVVIYGYKNGVLQPNHSMIVTSPNSTNGRNTILESKLGVYGVYRAPLYQMMEKYSGSKIRVYRPN